MDETLLQAVVDNSQIPHQPLVLITHSALFSARPLFHDIVKRSSRRGKGTTLVSVLYPPDTITNGPGSRTNVVDLTSSIDGYGTFTDWDSIQERILASYETTRGEVIIDAVDILAEDYSIQVVVRLIRTLLRRMREHKAPSRLVLMLSHSSSLFHHLESTSLSSTLTHLHPSHPSLLVHLSKLYLTPISPSPKYWQILQIAHARRTSEHLAYTAQEGFEISPWSTHAASSSSESSPTSGAVVQVLVRRAAGGAKGITRALAALLPPSSDGQHLIIDNVTRIVPLNPFNPPDSLPTRGEKEVTHADLNLAFNLTLTDAQRKQRMSVPLPYAHEGEGADLLYEEEDMSDEDE
ncbi:hypothetical protein TREMEDRAFT_64707 [Tremella mesenterica DSM 1558]|uniref:uncharacterized protein n=1 Tax=Tremella mesenterica (strain ATCC 24925 / CBS 8224 / DSM 1558 / NBRC 9311 / NRRL Y-6157 / RJB 2259-6 / UBC 559-6) TaxID=578456 RepID=UPI0003F49E1D|nr:uncharacterized protein TREMEDRAFT_64707 [Tremella mesenterica DSM 1558]EIW67452.1 hypothetical protein TREMEDRAFT_64707 [Tremella mesenterica DSM 1558]